MVSSAPRTPGTTICNNGRSFDLTVREVYGDENRRGYVAWVRVLDEPPLTANAFRCVGLVRGRGRAEGQAVDCGVEEVAENAAPSSPDVEYRVSDLPGGGQEILFPSLVPNEQVAVSSLYIPPGNLGSDQPRGQVRLDLCFRRDVGKGNLPLFTLQSKSSTEA